MVVEEEEKCVGNAKVAVDNAPNVIMTMMMMMMMWPVGDDRSQIR